MNENGNTDKEVDFSLYSNENGHSVSVIGGADGPTSVFIAGRLGGEDTVTYRQISMDEAKQIFEIGLPQSHWL